MTVLHRWRGARTQLERMMECSQLQISEIAQHGEAPQKLVASRVLETPRTQRHWESAHVQLLRDIVNISNTGEQIRAVKRMALAMIHRKAPFEYLRDRRVCGLARRRFFEVVYGRQDFSSAFVKEHRNYLEAGASYLCVERFCSESSMRLLARYEQSYTVYLRGQVRQLDDEHCGRHERSAAWLGYLRSDLQMQRRRLLAMSPSKADTLTLKELYQPADDSAHISYFASGTRY